MPVCVDNRFVFQVLFLQVGHLKEYSVCRLESVDFIIKMESLENYNMLNASDDVEQHTSNDTNKNKALKPQIEDSSEKTKHQISSEDLRNSVGTLRAETPEGSIKQPASQIITAADTQQTNNLLSEEKESVKDILDIETENSQISAGKGSEPDAEKDHQDNSDGASHVLDQAPADGFSTPGEPHIEHNTDSDTQEPPATGHDSRQLTTSKNESDQEIMENTEDKVSTHSKDTSDAYPTASSPVPVLYDHDVPSEGVDDTKHEADNSHEADVTQESYTHDQEVGSSPQQQQDPNTLTPASETRKENSPEGVLPPDTMSSRDTTKDNQKPDLYVEKTATSNTDDKAQTEICEDSDPKSAVSNEESTDTVHHDKVSPQEICDNPASERAKSSTSDDHLQGSEISIDRKLPQDHNIDSNQSFAVSAGIETNHDTSQNKFSITQAAEEPSTSTKDIAENSTFEENIQTTKDDGLKITNISTDKSSELPTQNPKNESKSISAESDSGCSGLDGSSDRSHNILTPVDKSTDVGLSERVENDVGTKSTNKSKPRENNDKIISNDNNGKQYQTQPEGVSNEKKSGGRSYKKPESKAKTGTSSKDQLPESTEKSRSPKTVTEKDQRKKGRTKTQSKLRKPSNDESIKPSGKLGSGIQRTCADQLATKREKPNPKKSAGRPVNSVKHELNTQLSNYLYDERRMLGFNPNSSPSAPAFSTVLHSPVKLHKRDRPDPRSCYRPMVSQSESKRLSKIANQMFDSLDISEIWNFHEFKVGKGTLNKSPRNGFVQNYSRHLGNILHTSEYQRFYDQLYSKKS